MLRSLVDPNKVMLRGRPKTVEDVFVAAANNWLVSYENLSGLTPEQQDAFCTLATGGGFASRQLYTNGEEHVMETKRPVVLNGIAVVATRPDLIDRVIHVDLPTIAAEARRDDADTHAGAAIARERRDGGQVKLSTFIPLRIRKRGASKVVVRPDGAVESPGKVASQIDQPLLVALKRAFYWQQLLDDGVVGSEIAQREGLHHSTVNELLRLTLLEPAIIQSILAGQQPRCMSLLWFQRNPLPTDWVAQREVVARFDA